jgi:hypothetical protein
MSLDDDFVQEMAQSVSIQALSAGGLYGPTYAAAVVYSCYAKQAVKNIRKDDGTDAVSSLQLYMDGHPAILSTAKITYGSATPPILKIQKLYDENGGAYATVIYT